MAKRFPQGRVRALERENERAPDYGCPDGHIDDAETENNYHIIYPKGPYMNLMSPYMCHEGKKGPVAYAMSCVVSSDEQFFERYGDACIHQFFEDAAAFFVKRYTLKCVFSAVVHVDEGLPHLHVNFFPYDMEGQLLPEGQMDKEALTELQDDLYEEVGKPWRLQRGDKTCGVETRTHEAYLQARLMYQYQQEVLAITQQIEDKRNELWKVTDRVEEMQRQELDLKSSVRTLQMEKESLQHENKQIMARVLDYTDYIAGMEMAVLEDNPYRSKDRTIEVLKARNFAISQQVYRERDEKQDILSRLKDTESRLRSAEQCSAQYRAKAELAERLMDLFPEEWEELEKKLAVLEESREAAEAVQEKTA